MADCSLQRTEVFLKNRHVSFIGPYCPSKVKVFICTCRLFHTYSKKVHEMRGLEQVVASALLKSCMLGEECVILLFQKEYAGLRVKKALPPSWHPLRT